MGYNARLGTSIIDFWPDDDDKTMHLESSSSSSLTMTEILDIAKSKWPDATLDNITITSENIHTECITYDRYDPCDYTEFIILTYKN